MLGGRAGCVTAASLALYVVAVGAANSPTYDCLRHGAKSHAWGQTTQGVPHQSWEIFYEVEWAGHSHSQDFYATLEWPDDVHVYKVEGADPVDDNLHAPSRL